MRGQQIHQWLRKIRQSITVEKISFQLNESISRVVIYLIGAK